MSNTHKPCHNGATSIHTRWYRATTILGLGLIIAMLLAANESQASWRGGHHDKDDMVERVSDKLDLNDSQEDKLEKVFDALDDHKDQMKDKYKNLHKDHKKTAEAFWKNPDITAEGIINFHNNQRQSMQSLMQFDKGVAQAIADFHASLNEDQREEFAEFMSRRGLMMGGGKHGYMYKDGYHRGKKGDDRRK